MTDYIYTRANELIKKCKSRDVYEILDHLKIHLYLNDDLRDLLGFYTVINKRRAIVVNNNLDEFTKRQVISHEIGHDQLHRHLLSDNAIFKEFHLNDMRTKPEYEANAFASHLLIDDREIIQLGLEYDDYEKISSCLGVNINMLMIKILELNKMGAGFNQMFIPKGDFLK